MAKTVLIGCKLPHGIALNGTAGQLIVINGLNTARVLGGFGITHVEEGEAAFLFAQYAEFPPFKSQAIFTTETAKVADILDMGRDLQDEATGFEGLNPEKPAAGLNPEGNVSKAIEAAQSAPVPVKVPKSAADRAAAAEAAGA